jgi:hypothetical protein
MNLLKECATTHGSLSGSDVKEANMAAQQAGRRER